MVYPGGGEDTLVYPEDGKGNLLAYPWWKGYPMVYLESG